MLSHVRLCDPTDCSSLGSSVMEFFRIPWPEYWSGEPLPSQGDLLDPGIKLWSLALQADSSPSEPADECMACCGTWATASQNPQKSTPSPPAWLALVSSRWESGVHRGPAGLSVLSSSSSRRLVFGPVLRSHCFQKQLPHGAQLRDEEARRAGSFLPTPRLLALNQAVKVSYSVLLTLCDPTDYTVLGILQARVLEWVAFPFSK